MFGTKLTPAKSVKLKTDMGEVALVLTVKLLDMLTTKVALSTLVIAASIEHKHGESLTASVRRRWSQ